VDLTPTLLWSATRFYPRVDCDVDYALEAERWIDGVVAALQRQEVVSAKY
jgi:hypothetical protein